MHMQEISITVYLHWVYHTKSRPSSLYSSFKHWYGTVVITLSYKICLPLLASYFAFIIIKIKSESRNFTALIFEFDNFCRLEAI
jgi:hypothetical protein